MRRGLRLSHVNSAPPPPANATAPSPKLSVVAVLAFMAGVLGFTVIGSIVGMVLGLVAKFRINRSEGRLRGRGFAWAGIILSAVWLVALTVAVVGFLLPAIAKAQAGMLNYPGGGERNLLRLGKAVQFYQDDNGGKFPPGENWCATLRPLLGARAELILRRPGAATGSACGYGYNAAVAGLTSAEVNAKTVIFFELDSPACDIAGGADLLRHPVNERDRVLVYLANGRVSAVVATNLATLRWKP
jgi:Domain of unknown function (DUF4190)